MLRVRCLDLAYIYINTLNWSKLLLNYLRSENYRIFESKRIPFTNNWPAQVMTWIWTNLSCSHDGSCWPNVAKILQLAAHNPTLSLLRLEGLQFLHSLDTFAMNSRTVYVWVWHAGRVLKVVHLILFSHLYCSIQLIAAFFLHNDILIGHTFFFCPWMGFGCCSFTSDD